MDKLHTDVLVRSIADMAKKKGAYGFRKLIILSFFAGVYISMGALLSTIVGYGSPLIYENAPGISRLLTGATFPIGMILVMLLGAELFTGNTSYFMPSVLQGEQPWSRMFRNWGIVWVGNFIGALFFAYFFVYLSGIMSDEVLVHAAESIAHKKVSNPLFVTILKGMGANWLVCLAVWMSMTADTTLGKIIALWWPVMTFVTIGYEHSIANMYYIPIAMMSGSDITISQFVFNNLIPATLGNILGGAFFVGTLYWYAYMKLHNKK